MKKLLGLFGASAVIALISINPASAQTLTFEGQSNTQYGAPITRSGFIIGNPTGQEQHFHEIDSTQFSLVSNGTGILLNDRDTQIFLRGATGSAFSLAAFDIASSGSSNVGGSTFTATGFLGGVQVGVISGALSSTAFNTFGGFANVDNVIFDGFGGGGGFELDNIVLRQAVAGVPEPATWAMMAMGFGLVGGALRSRKNATTRVRYA